MSDFMVATAARRNQNGRLKRAISSVGEKEKKIVTCS